MKILLFGKNGQLGRAIAPLLEPLGTLRAVDLDEVDIGDPEVLEHFLLADKADLVVNAAAYTNVDAAENDEATARKVNAFAPGCMASVLRRWNGVLIHYSTDYVFDGQKQAPYIETDAVNPLNAYGRSKLEGECLVQETGARYWIFRTSWVYAAEAKNFVTNVLKWAKTNDTLRVVTDQVGSPTWAGMLAEQTVKLITAHWHDLADYVQETHGIYHCAGKGAASRFELAEKVLALAFGPGTNPPALLPALSSDFPSNVQRPVYSALDCTKFEETFRSVLPGWEDGIDSYFFLKAK